MSRKKAKEIGNRKSEIGNRKSEIGSGKAEVGMKRCFLLPTSEFALSALFLLAALMLYALRHHIFFWDTIQLGSKHAHWYYENNFQYLLLPDQIDSGHPPVFGMYLAALWSLFGKSLAVSHFAMLPFIWGIIYGLYRLGKHYGAQKYTWWFPLIALADPVMAGQLVLISPDLVLVCGFLLAWYAIISDKPVLKAFAAILMAMISTRGMMVVFALFIFESFRDNRWSLKSLFQRALPYVPSGLLSVAFLAFHYYEKGWIGYHPDSPWAPSFDRVGLPRIGYNFLVLGWRFLDFGRLFVWLSGIGVLLYFWKKGKRIKDKEVRNITLGTLILTLFLSITFLLYQGLQSHRYLLPAFLALNLLVFTLISRSEIGDWAKKGLLAMIFVGLATGNLWIYPDKVSQDWDCTLAHLPYYELREEVLVYLDEENIALPQVGTAFPDIGLLKYKDLTGRLHGFKEKSLQNDEYILYSNIMNDFTDEEIDALRREWKVVKVWKNRGIRFVLYKRL